MGRRRYRPVLHDRPRYLRRLRAVDGWAGGFRVWGGQKGSRGEGGTLTKIAQLCRDVFVRAVDRIGYTRRDNGTGQVQVEMYQVKTGRALRFFYCLLTSHPRLSATSFLFLHWPRLLFARMIHTS